MKLKSFKLFSICTSVAVFITSQIPTLPAKSGIFDGFGRCGSAGEGHVTVTNNLRTTVYVLTDKNDKAGGPDGAELAPGQSNRTPICNRNGLRVKVYTSMKCGKTFLSESRFSRVYNEDFVSIKPSGFAFRVGDVLDVGSRIGGVALTYIAAGYGIPPEALSALGVNEAEVTGACLKGGIGCARAIYKYKNKLPSDLLTTINADKCLATILQPQSSSVSSQATSSSSACEKLFSSGRSLVAPHTDREGRTWGGKIKIGSTLNGNFSDGVNSDRITINLDSNNRENFSFTRFGGGQTWQGQCTQSSASGTWSNNFNNGRGTFTIMPK